jgi:hypothetical protein
MISASAMDENQFVTVNAYYAKPEKIFSVPANYSLDEIQAAIRSEMGAATLTFEPPSLASSVRYGFAGFIRVPDSGINRERGGTPFQDPVPTRVTRHTRLTGEQPADLSCLCRQIPSAITIQYIKPKQ